MERVLEELRVRFGVTAADGVQLLTPTAVLRRPFDPGMAALLLPEVDTGADTMTSGDANGFEPAALPGRHAHGADAVHMLAALYPAGHPVHGLDGTPEATIGELTPASLATGMRYLPALAPLANNASPYGLPWLVARLRAPDGCPWDREQDHRSLRKFLLEESYEVYDALDAGSTPELAQELGDLLLQIVLHAQYAAEAGVFDMTDVHRSVMTKIVHRHPHVFGDVTADSSADVLRNWEQIKAGERASRSADGTESAAADPAMPAAFAGLSRSLPALAYAQEMQERAASLGYDWPSVEGVLEKVTEEAREIAEAEDDRARTEELGDLLLVMVNLSRRLGIDAEAALRAASAKFAARFAQVERIAGEREVELRNLTLEELDELWEEAKVVAR
ncbi:MAG TPA: nucleoside triphosphate pyrophosphohydrolase [Candidatus Limnocylindrales bacterium]|nr:nucleoside triphosphate pyrophosphohydrolase [Candidatus Limnocylindrales bacterium]